jgi:hypothetical protein
VETRRQTDFSAGISRQRIAPPNAVYEAVNCLIDGLGRPYKRGGSAFWSGSNAGNTLVRLAALFYPALNASRVTAAGGGQFYAFNGTAPVAIRAIGTPGRPASVGGMAVFPIGAGGRLAYYAGSLKSSSYHSGTVSTTAGSAVVTGSGTAFLANVDPGMILRHVGSGRMLVVKSVDSDTQVTLTTAWPTTNTASTLFTWYPLVDSGVELAFPFPTLSPATYVASAGSGLPRLILTTGNRAYESLPGDASLNPVTFSGDTYQELPSGAEIIGAEGVGDSCLLFTTTDVWRIDNLSLDPVDALGNQQQSVVRVTSDVVLWGDRGIAGWQGGVIVPATDDVRLMTADGQSVSVTGDPGNSRVRDLYRSYVAAGYQPGGSAVFSGHYFLSIVDSNDVVKDALVCRLDRGSAWTRFSGHAMSPAYSVLSRTASSPPKLLGLAGQRVTDLTGVLTPVAANAQDADGSNVAVTIISNDYVTQDDVLAATVASARLKYEMAGDGTHANPSLALAVSSDRDGDVYTTLTDSGLQGGGTAGQVSDGSRYSWFRVTRKRARLRLRITTSGACASFVLRSIELLFRRDGRQ